MVLDCEHVIVAAGGKAYPTLGSRGELFGSLENLGHQRFAAHACSCPGHL